MSVAITGWAWRTPLGVTVDDAIARLLAGEHAARPDPQFETYACTRVARIPGEPTPSRQRRFVRRMGMFAIETAHEALAHSGRAGGPRLGLFSAVGGLRPSWDEMLPGLIGLRSDGRHTWSRGFRQLHPFWMLQHLSNNAHALASAEIGVRGEGVTFGGANAGAQALVAARRALEAGSIDAALVMAYDSLLDADALVDLGARDSGVVPGEAAAALVLERRDSPRALAFVDAADAADGEPGEPRADTIERVMRRFETARVIDVSAASGYLGAATSIVQTIAIASCLRRKLLPGRERATPTDERAALAISTGAPGLVGVVRVEVPG